jgi:outer membrane lipoprotein-sorting protein
MSKETSVFGTVVITMVVTAVGLAGGYYAVTQYLGPQTLGAGQADDSAAAPAPQRKGTQARKSSSGGSKPQGPSSTESAPSVVAVAETVSATNEDDAPQATEEQRSDAPADAEVANVSPSAPEPTSAADAGDSSNPRTIIEESERRAQAKFYRYDGLLQSFNADGKTSEKRWTFDRVGSNGQSKAVLRFTAPAEVKGVALLIHNHPERASDQWMWTPALQRDRRIALQDRSTRFFGTDFSFEDLEERDVDQYDYSMLGSETIDGAGCWKIEMTPKKGRSHYTRSIAWIRKDNYVLERLDHFVEDDVVKRLTNSSIENVQGVWTARQLEMADLRRGTRTRLTLEQVKYNTPTSERDFTLEAIRH